MKNRGYDTARDGTVTRRIQCGLCGGVFSQTVDRRSAAMPDECPLCHDTGSPTEQALVWRSREQREADQAVQKMVSEGRGPGYRADARAQLRSEEQVFRAMEAGANFRAEAAASDLNVPVSEMSNLKITDMKDNPKPGENSAKIPMSQDALGMQNWAKQQSFQDSTGKAFVGSGSIINGKQVGTMVGPAAGHHGEGMRSLITQTHAQKAAEFAGRGQMGKYG